MAKIKQLIYHLKNVLWLSTEKAFYNVETKIQYQLKPLKLKVKLTIVNAKINLILNIQLKLSLIITFKS